MGRIVYNKENSGKKLSRGGPRDIQLRQRIMYEEAIRESQTPVILTKDKSSKAPPTVDLSQYLSLDKVKIKIEEAVEHTKEIVKAKYESGIKSLTDQLNESKSNIDELKNEISKKNLELVNLREKISSTPEISDKALKQLNKKDLRIVELESETKLYVDKISNLNRDISDMKGKVENAINLVQEKDAEVKEVRDAMAKRDAYLREKDIEIHNKNAELREKEKDLSKKEIEITKLKSKTDSMDVSGELSKKLDRLYQKISDGSIRHLVGSNMDRPALENKIFIDPLESTAGENLDPHIKIKEEKYNKKEDRSVSADADKLRNLLKSGKGRR